MGLKRTALPARLRRVLAPVGRVVVVRGVPEVDRVAGGRDGVLVLPYPISANRYWRTKVIGGGRGRGGAAYVSTYVSKEAEAFKGAVAWEAKRQGVRMLEGEVVVEIDLYRPQKSGDLDNRIKVLLDALRGLAYEDDDQVARIVAQRHDDKERPRAQVRVFHFAEG